MLPKANRLHLSQDIFTVRKTGLRYQNDFCMLFIQRNNSLTEPQFAFVVSTKISKRAVQRNRTKRLLRQSVHNLLKDTQPARVVCVAKANLSDVPLQEVQMGMIKLLQEAKLIT